MILNFLATNVSIISQRRQLDYDNFFLPLCHSDTEEKLFESKIREEGKHSIP